MKALLKRIAGKFGEKKRLRAEVERLGKLASALMEPEITALEIRGRGLVMDMKANVASALLADGFFDVLDEMGAENYVELGFERDHKMITVTVQRVEGKRPSEIIAQLKERVKDLENQKVRRCPSWCGRVKEVVLGTPWFADAWGRLYASKACADLCICMDKGVAQPPAAPAPTRAPGPGIVSK